MNDSILQKIKKLLALAGNNPNEAEASLAAQKAQELMTKYNVEASQVSLNLSESTSDAYGRADVDRSLKLVVWKAQLLQAIARATFCSVYCSGGTTTIVGNCTAIVVANAYDVSKTEIKRYLSETGLKLGKARSSNSKANSAYMQGYTTGGSVSLSPQGKLSAR